MTLIPYAGKDGNERQVDAFGHITPRRAVSAYARFLGGMDTLEIAKRYCVSEPTVLEWVTLERCARRDLLNPYSRSREAA